MRAHSSTKPAVNHEGAWVAAVLDGSFNAWIGGATEDSSAGRCGRRFDDAANQESAEPEALALRQVARRRGQPAPSSAMVLDNFPDLLDADDWPAALAARIRARYTVLARAREYCTRDRW